MTHQYPAWRLRHVRDEAHLRLVESHGVLLPNLYEAESAPQVAVRFAVVDGTHVPDFPVAQVWPVMSKAAAALFEEHVICAPVELEYADGRRDDDSHVLVIVRNVLDALDAERSNFAENPWLAEAPPSPRTPYLRRDLDYPPIFRIKSFLIPLFVNHEAAQQIDDAELSGFGFGPPDGAL